MKRILWFTLLLALLLSACSKVTEQAPTKTPTQAPTKTPIQTALKANTPEPEQVSAEPGCTVVSSIQEPDPTVVALFPPPGEDDWTRGPKTASVTILEYSDFQ